MEIVNFISFLEEKIIDILLHIFMLLLLIFILAFSNIHVYYIFLIAILYSIIEIMFIWICYIKEKRDNEYIIDLIDKLEEKYYIAEIIPKPKAFHNEAYYYALKMACKAMNDRISELMLDNEEYQEYVESFAHEIKVPIGALSLTFDNEKNFALKRETDKIFQLVEQMLYYARSENTQKDYFVKALSLEEVVHTIILKFRHYLIEEKVIVKIKDIQYTVYTDEKWLIFILSQIVQNSIKYLNKEHKYLSISGKNNKNNITLLIEDNGCGIRQSELNRVFEKGFTGSNRGKLNSTGMGLYLTKKLCDRLGLGIEIDSIENQYTRLYIIFPMRELLRTSPHNNDSAEKLN